MSTTSDVELKPVLQQGIRPLLPNHVVGSALLKLGEVINGVTKFSLKDIESHEALLTEIVQNIRNVDTTVYAWRESFHAIDKDMEWKLSGADSNEIVAKNWARLEGDKLASLLTYTMRYLRRPGFSRSLAVFSA